MTLGFTGVVWFPRGATWNSTALSAGIGPTGLSAANGAWTAVAASMTDASATVAKVIADLGANWEGVASVAAIAKLVPFQKWTEQTATLASETAIKAATVAGANTVARLAMPSLAEIAAVKAAKTAAYAASGALVGSGAAAEAADRAMDLRASLVMEAYEGASTIVAAPRSFTPPPPLATGASGTAEDGPEAVTPQSLYSEFLVNPAGAAQTAAGVVMAHAQNPAVVSAASQAGSLAGSGMNAVANVTSSLAPVAASALGAGDAFGVRSGGAAAPGAAGGGETRATRIGGAGLAGAVGVGGAAAGAASGAGSSRITLPEGWGSTGAGAAVRPAAPVLAPVPGAEAAAAAGNRGGQLGAPMSGAARPADDEEHSSSRSPGADYLKSFEHFEDGRVVIPSVIGGDR